MTGILAQTHCVPTSYGNEYLRSENCLIFILKIPIFFSILVDFKALKRKYFLLKKRNLLLQITLLEWFLLKKRRYKARLHYQNRKIQS
jgi:hypothetical protein